MPEPSKQGQKEVNLEEVPGPDPGKTIRVSSYYRSPPTRKPEPEESEAPGEIQPDTGEDVAPEE